MKKLEPLPRRTFDASEIFARAQETIRSAPLREAEGRSREKDSRLAALKLLTTEERLAIIERWIDEHSEVRHGYVPPPRFGA